MILILNITYEYAFTTIGKAKSIFITLDAYSFCAINRMFAIYDDCQRPYHVEYTSSRPITEVKQRRA